MTEQEQRAEFVKGLRELADFIEERELPPCGLELNVSGWVHQDAAEFSRLARRFGPGEKDASHGAFFLRRRFPGDIVYDLTTERETVCERVVVGTEEVEEPVGDDTRPTVKREVEKVEWRCPDSILAGAER